MKSFVETGCGVYRYIVGTRECSTVERRSDNLLLLFLIGRARSLGSPDRRHKQLIDLISPGTYDTHTRLFN